MANPQSIIMKSYTIKFCVCRKRICREKKLLHWRSEKTLSSSQSDDLIRFPRSTLRKKIIFLIFRLEIFFNKRTKVIERKFCIDFSIMKSSINFLKREHKMRKKNRYANHFFHRIEKIYLIFDFFSDFLSRFRFVCTSPDDILFFSSWSNFLCVYRSKGGEPEKALKKSMNLNNAQIKIHIVESAT